jgi:hypothetical protein
MLFDKFGVAEFVISEAGAFAARLPYTRNEALRDGLADLHKHDRSVEARGSLENILRRNAV